ncbi:MAG: asparagine synthase (glutamine-hydrolyzing) [Phycisphaerae bacterium]|nr:asparagine synthase (glutamine-hydrolyzing) [Phycisphaerae bacterium]
MCGIAGIIGSNDESAVERAQAMIDVLRHRGPDDQGVQRIETGALGHARLSIIDLAGGHQPMGSWDEKYWITFNGEIYNYEELRDDLVSRGHTFRTKSDTEVLIEAFRAWGAECVHRLNGMFAFALWDSQERCLFAARDRFGKKPFYYATTSSGALVFASELKSLVASRLLELQLDLTTVDAYLTFGYVPPDRCIYANVHALPPGHVLLCRQGCVNRRRYWEPVFAENRISDHEAAEELRQRLGEAVRKRLTASDVPVGAFLSGGLDSSTVVILGQRQMPNPIRTFSVHVVGHQDETPFAEEVSNQERTEHHHVELDVDAAETMREMSRVYDEPFADPAAIPTYLLARFAARYSKVVLTGDGGDEVFGGYDGIYLPLVRSEHVPNRGLRYHALRLADQGCERLFRRCAFRSPLHELRAAADEARIRPDIIARRTVWSPVAPESRVKWWAAQHTPYGIPEDLRSASSFGLNRVLGFDMQFLLPADMMVKTDRATMAHGLEARCPFLDPDVVDFALSLSLSKKISGFTCKKIVRDAFSSSWPPSLRTRKKMGFSVPLHLWLRQPAVREMVQDVLADRSGAAWHVLSRQHADQAVNSFYRFDSVPALEVWTVASLLLWFRQWSGQFALPGH